MLKIPWREETTLKERHFSLLSFAHHFCCQGAWCLYYSPQKALQTVRGHPFCPVYDASERYPERQAKFSVGRRVLLRIVELHVFPPSLPAFTISFHFFLWRETKRTAIYGWKCALKGETGNVKPSTNHIPPIRSHAHLVLRK